MIYMQTICHNQGSEIATFNHWVIKLPTNNRSTYPQKKIAAQQWKLKSSQREKTAGGW